MAKPNYQYEKRQRELEKKKKKEEKAQRKSTPGHDGAGDDSEPSSDTPTLAPPESSNPEKA